ncbi:MAG: hypothetical protein NUW01_14210 [Gemmatimonadaceae bacterium]|nr:hypothetical protein [Gemmatimonadaceae bacterium]
MSRTSTLSGWRLDPDNSRLEFYYNGTKVGHLDASGFTVTDGSTTFISNGVAQYNGVVQAQRVKVARIGSAASVASNGAGAILPDPVFVAPGNIKVLSAWRVNISGSDVTKGTATTSTSYRRMNLIANVTGAGSGTTIVASLNATASAASKVSRAFAVTTDNTMPAGAVVLASHLTVGAETAEGTDMADNIIEIAYEAL